MVGQAWLLGSVAEPPVALLGGGSLRSSFAEDDFTGAAGSGYCSLVTVSAADLGVVPVGRVAGASRSSPFLVPRVPFVLIVGGLA
jgi:hypothetical protein